jgi:Iap family predicted aminopeptidase
LNGIHIDINGQKVVTPLRAIFDGIGYEEWGMYSLTLKSALHIRCANHHCVDFSVSYIFF